MPNEDATPLLPFELEEILDSSPIVKRDRLILSAEKTCKNRGLLQLKNLLKADSSNLLVDHKTEADLNSIFFKDEESNQILLAEFSGPVWKAKCPTIMGQHYIDCFIKMAKRFMHIQKLIIIDWTEMLDFAKVTAGSQAALKIFLHKKLEHKNLEIFNIFFSDTVGEIYEIKQYRNNSLLEIS